MKQMKRKLKYGMVGGGRGAFIGAVHRMAAALDGQLELVCGAFSSDPVRCRESGADLFVAPERCYPTFDEMMVAERALPDGDRMDFAVIVTPNHLHFPAAKAALENGFHVVSDKPATFDLGEARALERLVGETGQLYCLTHNYTGYPMVRQARAMIASGALGKIRKVIAEYPQGWLARPIEREGQKQASWRTDPARSGAGGCLGDIGSHAENLACYVTGLRLDEVAADLTAFVPGRRLDDDVNILMRFEGGAKGILQSSQIAVGEENNLRLFVYGEEGGIEWHQAEPNTLWFKPLAAPAQRFRTGVGALAPEAVAATRLPAAHPEGYLEAFANLYRGFASHLRSLVPGGEPRDPLLDYPGIAEGVRGMAFIEAAVASSAGNAAWTKIAG
jgi:predicted dehydrogenase